MTSHAAEGDSTPVRTVGLYRALASAQNEGRTSAVELTQSALDRIAAAAHLNAVILIDSDAALQQADAVDRRRAEGEPLGMLAGIPALVKDNTDVRGLPTTHGSLVYAAAAAADRDDSVVELLRTADAVIVGKTNLSEFAMEAIADNRVFGGTHNPWRRGYSPGGSSGGSAAALAAGLAAAATATDGGGSARIPAALCGLLGLKPTSGVAGSSAARLPLDLSSTGPLAHTVADLRMMSSLTLRPASGDPSCVSGPDPSWRGRPVGRVFAVARIAGDKPIDADVERAFLAAAEEFADSIGKDAEFVDNGVLDAAAEDVWATIYAAEDVVALGANVVEQHRELLDPRVTPWVELGLTTTLDEYLEARRLRCGYVGKLDELLATNNLVLSPTLATAGYPVNGHGDDLMPIDLFNTAALNLTGHPAVSVPAGYVEQMPFGLQIVGPRGSDLWLIDLLEGWERHHPWPLTAPGYDLLTAAIVR